MAEPQQAGYGFEPLPLSVEDPRFSTIQHDIARGYNTSELRGDAVGVRTENVPSHGMPSRTAKIGNERGMGLTAGDRGK